MIDKLRAVARTGGPPSGRRTGRLVLAAALLVAPLMTAAPAALAGTTPAPAPAPSPEAAALAEAGTSGEPVEVDAARTETGELLANPDGTLTRREHLRPVRARIGGSWRPVDDTLRRNPDGTVSPRATTFAMTFSGGGAGPLATLVKDGRKLELSWPSRLPVPVLDGDTATYADVLPGVDLKVIAEPDNFVHHLIVKDRAAAADPRVRTLKLGVRGEGLDVTATAEGGITAADGGTPVFSAPVPRMWDSSHTAAAKGLAAAGPHEDGPVRNAPMKATVEPGAGGGTLRIVPDRTLLDDPATVYPVVIDPIFSGGYRNHWANAVKKAGNSGVANTVYYDGGNKVGSENPPVARAGHENDTGLTARAYFEMNINGLQGARILAATFNVFNVSSWSCSARPVDLGWTGGIGNWVTWNNQPGWIRTLQTKSFAHGWGSCGSAGEDFADGAVAGAVQEAANNGQSNITFGLRAADESDTYGWKKFKVDGTNPVLQVTYNRAPRLVAKTAYQGPWNSNSSDRPIPCSATNPTWEVVGNTDVTLTATGGDPDGGNLDVGFGLWFHDGPAVRSDTRTVASGSTATVTVPADQLQDGGHYWWHASVSDGVDGDWSTNSCPFKVDKTAPTKPVVTSADGRRIDVGEVPARYTRKVRLTSSDANLDGFCYRLNRPLSVGGGRCAAGTWVKAGPDGSATVEIYPHRWPNNRLHVAAIDVAGNISPYDASPAQTATNTTLIVTAPPVFVADPDGTVSGDRDGDLTGDGRPDILATNNSGTLRLYAGRGDGTTDGGTDVGASGFGGALLAHRGDFVGTEDGMGKDGYEDIFVRSASGKLSLYPNEGTGWPNFEGRRELRHPGGGDWSAATRIIAPGNLDGRPGADLIVVEGGRLDLYTGTAAGMLALAANGELAAPRVLDVPSGAAGSAPLGLDGYDAFVPGDVLSDVDGDGAPDPGNAADLVLRRRDSGAVTLYPGSFDDAGTYVLGAPRPYGAEPWPAGSHPWIAAPGDLQGQVVDVEGVKTFQPAAGKEGPDFWVAAQTAALSDGLYLYAGSPAGREPAVNVGGPGWTGWITGIS
ncbi:DNRLRE domain-containing protein [Nonomuraea sp. NPDC001636]|uniref:DNRLRE domain-containing protein n=1 Tax=Nonomuraea sp. NPDC001636 TaxID=3154391 RepID=UPI003333FBD5